jgi:hypothetical protein
VKGYIFLLRHGAPSDIALEISGVIPPKF